MKKILLLIALILLGWFFYKSLSAPQKMTTQNQTAKQETDQSSIIAQNLEIPWGLAFLPNGDILVTERPGRVKLIDKNGNVKLISELPSVRHIGEGGLMGIALDPDFGSNGFVYFYYTYGNSQDSTLNRVVRMTYKNDKLSNEQVVVDKIPGASNHNGGRIKFGPDKLLYIGTGDAQNPSQAQDRNSLAGKILRLRDGKVEIYSYGHRNVQGLAWDSNGNLWATEHGSSAHDELNRIERGKNYGWPDIRGNEQREGMEKPLLESGDDTWAPGGAAFHKGSIFFVGLRGSALYEYKINKQSLRAISLEQKLTEYFKNEYGRIRDLVLGPDEMLYIATSNRDGRGFPKNNDDKIIRIDPKSLR